MKALILGAGKMGTSIAYDFVRFPEFSKITICDSDFNRAKSVCDKTNSSKIEPTQLDITDFKNLKKFMKGYDIVMSAVSYKYNFELTQCAIESGCHFCDLGGNTDIVLKQLSLNKSAKRRKVRIIPDCGLAPGMVSILANSLYKKGAEEIHIRVGGLPVKPKGELKYQIVFSVEGLINEYKGKALILKNGKIKKVNTLEDVEEIKFVKPFGKLEAFNTSGGISTMPYSFEGKIKELDYKTIRYKGHCEKIKEIFKKYKGKKLQEYLESILPKEGKDVILLRVTGITGTGEKLQYESIDYADEKTGLSAMMRMTTFPACVLAQMILTDEITDYGVLLQELNVDPDLFLERLSQKGIKIEFEKTN